MPKNVVVEEKAEETVEAGRIHLDEPEGSPSAEGEQAQDIEFIEKLRGVLSPELIAALVADSPFGQQMQQQLSFLGGELKQQREEAAKTQEGLQNILNTINALWAQIQGSAGGDGSQPPNTVPPGGAIPSADPNAELKYWVHELKDLVFGSQAVPQTPPADQGTDQVVSTMKVMAEGFKAIFGSLADVITTVRQFDETAPRRRRVPVYEEEIPSGSAG